MKKITGKQYWLLIRTKIVFRLCSIICISCVCVCGGVYLSVCVEKEQKYVFPFHWGHDAKAAGRACHCQSLFGLLFCFLLAEEKVHLRDQTLLGVMWEFPVCLFTCVYLHIFTFREYFYAVCISRKSYVLRLPFFEVLLSKLGAQTQLSPSWWIVNSDGCRLYLPTISKVQTAPVPD